MNNCYDYYKHKYYNYDYEDMNDVTFSFDRNEKILMTSKVYPTKLEVKIDENTNRPYLYYEGFVHTNKGMCKITFPKLEMALDCVKIQTVEADTLDRLKYKFQPKITEYKMITEFSNITSDNVMYELRKFDESDYKNFGEYINKK